MKKRLGTILAAALMLGLSTAAFAKGGGSNPQFPAPAPAEWYVSECPFEIDVDWTAVVSNVNGSSPTKYAIQIIQTLHDGCPDGDVVGTLVNNYTAPGNATEFAIAGSNLALGQLCGPEDITILVKALNPPGKSQNNPQALAEFVGFGTGGCP